MLVHRGPCPWRRLSVDHRGAIIRTGRQKHTELRVRPGHLPHRAFVPPNDSNFRGLVVSRDLEHSYRAVAGRSGEILPVVVELRIVDHLIVLRFYRRQWSGRHACPMLRVLRSHTTQVRLVQPTGGVTKFRCQERLNFFLPWPIWSAPFFAKNVRTWRETNCINNSSCSQLRGTSFPLVTDLGTRHLYRLPCLFCLWWQMLHPRYYQILSGPKIWEFST